MNQIAEYRSQYVVMWIPMPKMLPETFSIAATDLLTSLLREPLHGNNILVHAVMNQKPVTLAFVTAKHLLFGIHR